MKILMIDDDSLLCKMYSDSLLDEGYEVEASISGEEGLRKMQWHPPDLLLLDILMPDMDGWTVLDKMQKDKKLKDVPVILLSNLERDEELEQKAAKYNVLELIQKDKTDPVDVVKHIKGIIEEKKLQKLFE